MAPRHKGCPPGKGWRAFQNKNKQQPSDGIRPISRAASNSQIQAAIDEALDPHSAPCKAKVMSRGDFTPEEIEAMTKLYAPKRK